MIITQLERDMYCEKRKSKTMPGDYHVYDLERDIIIETLSDEMAELESKIELERQENGFTTLYRNLLKTYSVISKHYLSLVKELEAKKATTDALTEFNL